MKKLKQLNAKTGCHNIIKNLSVSAIYGHETICSGDRINKSAKMRSLL
ncbi:hypothetical protein WKK05_09845 [Nostoc sp. UHCC 0302]